MSKETRAAERAGDVSKIKEPFAHHEMVVGLTVVAGACHARLTKAWADESDCWLPTPSPRLARLNIAGSSKIKVRKVTETPTSNILLLLELGLRMIRSKGKYRRMTRIESNERFGQRHEIGVIGTWLGVSHLVVELCTCSVHASKVGKGAAVKSLL